MQRQEPQRGRRPNSASARLFYFGALFRRRFANANNQQPTRRNNILHFCLLLLTMSFIGLLSSTATRTWTGMASRCWGLQQQSPFLLAIRNKHSLKTNKSVAKRFRVRGNGTLKRYVLSVVAVETLSVLCITVH